MELKFEQGANGKDYIGREVHVADSGDDKGMVLTMSQFSLKGDSAEPFEKGNIVHRERFVSTKWSKKKFADDEFVVPIEIRQEFSQGGSKDTLTQITKVDWKDFGKATELFKTEDAFVAYSKETEAKVNKMLNR